MGLFQSHNINIVCDQKQPEVILSLKETQANYIYSTPYIELKIKADFSKIGINNENVKIVDVNFYDVISENTHIINIYIKYVETKKYNADAKNGIEYITFYPIASNIHNTNTFIFKCGNISEKITLCQNK